MRQKIIYFRVTKKAPKRYLVEERHTFMFFWRFYVKGSIRLKLPKYYVSFQHAEKAINLACAKKGYRPIIIAIG